MAGVESGAAAGEARREACSFCAARDARFLFAILTLVYLLTTGGHVYSPDGVVMARVTESLVQRGKLSVEDPGYPPGFLTIGRDGESYAKYGVGFSVVAVPGFWVGESLGHWLPESSKAVLEGPTFLWYDVSDPRTAWSFFGASLTNAPITAAACALFFLFLVEIGYRRRTALTVSAVLALVSPGWVYAKTFFSEPLAMLLLVLFAYQTQRWSRRLRNRDALAAGFALGALVVVKIAHVLYWPLAGGVLGALLLTSGLSSPRRFRSLVLFSAGPALGLLSLGLLNLWRFGSPFASGYGAEAELWTTPWMEGFLGLLVSPGRGLFFAMPVAALAMVGLGASMKRAPLWTAFSVAVPCVTVALYCRWHGWDGGWAWGPRFLVPSMPFLLLLAAPVFDRFGRFAGRFWVWVTGGLTLLSGMFTLIGISVPATEYHQLLRTMIGAGYLPAARWSWEVWPVVGYWHLPKTYLTAATIFRTPDTTALRLLVVLLTVGLVVSLAIWRRGEAGRSGHPTD